MWGLIVDVLIASLEGLGALAERKKSKSAKELIGPLKVGPAMQPSREQVTASKPEPKKSAVPLPIKPEPRKRKHEWWE